MTTNVPYSTHIIHTIHKVPLSSFSISKPIKTRPRGIPYSKPGALALMRSSHLGITGNSLLSNSSSMIFHLPIEVSLLIIPIFLLETETFGSFATFSFRAWSALRGLEGLTRRASKDLTSVMLLISQSGILMPVSWKKRLRTCFNQLVYEIGW